MTNHEIPFLQALRAEFRGAATRETAMDAESSHTHGRRWALPAAVARPAGRGRILVGGGGLVGLAAVALAILILTATNATPPAWAVADHHDGTATGRIDPIRRSCRGHGARRDPTRRCAIAARATGT